MKKNALTLAYECVRRTMTNQQMILEFGLNRRTIYRIRDGQEVQPVTRLFCMRVFLMKINAAYLIDLHSGGTNSAYYHRLFHDMLMAEYDITDVHLEGAKCT